MLRLESRPRGHVSHELAGRIDPCQMGNKGGPRQRELRLAIFRQLAPGNAVGKGFCDGEVDHPFKPAKLLVTSKGEFVVDCVTLVKMRQREREQRQGVLASQVLKQRVGELGVNLETGSAEPAAQVPRSRRDRSPPASYRA